MGGARSASRRLILWFAVATVPATLALVWLASVVIQQDRSQARDRLEVEREQAADVGVAALARTLTDLEGPKGATLAGVPMLTFDARGVASRHGLLLPYSPAVSRPAPALPASFELAGTFEFSYGDPREAIRVILPFSRDERPFVRAEAWLRLARNYRKANDVERALDAFGELAQLGDSTVQGLPAGLMGRNGRALIFEAAGRTADLRHEATALLGELSSSRWRLTQTQFEHSLEQAAGWLGRSVADVRPPIDAERRSLLAAADAIWRDDVRADRLTPRRTIRVGDAPLLVLSRAEAEGVAVRLVTARVLDDAWRTNLPQTTGDVNYALTDPDGHPVIGAVEGTSSFHAIRTIAESGLPWTLKAQLPDNGQAPLSSGARLMLGGVALMLLVVVVSGYTIVRAVSREMRVARLQADFVAAVSHEFRTPLTSIRQLSEMLVRSRVGSDERRQQFYEAILGESERLRRLVEGLLDFGRMEAGRMQYRLESLDVGSLVRDVAEDVNHEAASTGHRITVHETDGAPPVRADRDALGHAIRNLLDNAVKYSPDHKAIDVDVTNGDGRVKVRVRDHGIGIPAAEQREIFERFVRGTSSTSRNIKGTGVGLAMAQEIVLAHRGTINVESAPGQGSTFIIDLPAEPALHA